MSQSNTHVIKDCIDNVRQFTDNELICRKNTLNLKKWWNPSQKHIISLNVTSRIH